MDVLTYWQLVKRDEPMTTLIELGTVAEHHCTSMSHALIQAIADAMANGSEYGWSYGQ